MKNSIEKFYNPQFLIIRTEDISEYSQVEEVVYQAFKSAEHSDGNEHVLVANLRKSTNFLPELSLVAIYENQLVGHILFTKLIISNDNNENVVALGLAPVSVLPQYQNCGIGARLIQRGHEVAKSLGYSYVVLLGYPDYYSRFGYQKASLFGIKPDFEVPEEYFMIASLTDDKLVKLNGTVHYPAEFCV